MRVDKFPDAGTKVQASEFLITSGGQAGNAAVAIARLGGKVSFSGPLGGVDDEVADRIVGILVRENIDCSRAVRVPGAVSSVSLILVDARGEKMIATRRNQGLSAVVPADADAAVGEVDAVLLDNHYPNFVTPICAAAQKRGIPRVLDLDRAVAPDDPPARREFARNRLGRSACAAARAFTDLRRRAQRSSAAASKDFSRSPTAPTASIGSRAAKSVTCRLSRSTLSTRSAPATYSTALSPSAWSRPAT